MQRENPNYLIVKLYKISINFNHSKFEDMRVIEINDMLYKITDRDYTFIKDKVEKYLLREASKTEIKQVIDRVLHYNKPAIADLSIKEINEGEYGIKFNEQNY